MVGEISSRGLGPFLEGDRQDLLCQIVTFLNHNVSTEGGSEGETQRRLHWENGDSVLSGAK